LINTSGPLWLIIFSIFFGAIVISYNIFTHLKDISSFQSYTVITLNKLSTAPLSATKAAVFRFFIRDPNVKMHYFVILSSSSKSLITLLILSTTPCLIISSYFVSCSFYAILPKTARVILINLSFFGCSLINLQALGINFSSTSNN